MTAYTPAPWHLDRGQVRTSSGDVVASYPYTLGDAVDHANGRLIAAAPELADMLRAIVNAAYLSDTKLAQTNPRRQQAIEQAEHDARELLRRIDGEAKQ